MYKMQVTTPMSGTSAPDKRHAHSIHIQNSISFVARLASRLDLLIAPAL
jgi:hypothetical protein